MTSVYDNIQAGKYENKLKYPSHEDAPNRARIAELKAEIEKLQQGDKDWRRVAMEAYHRESGLLTLQLRGDLEAEHDMTGHPKALVLWIKAWDEGHSNGFSEVATCYADLVELAK